MGKILVVDDEREMCEILSHSFSNEGFDVDTAFDGEEALIKAQNNKYDYLLVDLVLPGWMNGMEIIKKVRTILPDAFIIAYSGFNDNSITEKVLQAGANTFLEKPFRHQELLALLNHKKNNIIL